MAEFPVRPLTCERLATAAAEGRILAQEVHAPEDVPAFPRSMVDGYAVIATDVIGATRTAPVRLALAGEVLMGKSTGITLRRGEAAAVPTGGALPGGTTGLIKIEDTELRGDHILIYDAEDCADRINPAASDVRAGALLFSAGALLSPAAVGLLAASGVAEVDVYKKPVVAVLVTGDELVPAKEKLGEGQIHESNGVALGAALAATGCVPRVHAIIADQRQALEQALASALDECDAVLISGGSSAGHRDYAPEVVARAGEPGVVVHGVRAKPGRPVMLAMIGDRPVVGLPGNPVSALVMFEALARPIVMRMFGIDDRPLPMRARLESAIAVDAGLEHRIPVRLLHGVDGLIARPLMGSSSQLHILAFADGIVIVPEGSGGLAADTPVDAIPFSRTRIL